MPYRRGGTSTTTGSSGDTTNVSAQDPAIRDTQDESHEEPAPRAVQPQTMNRTAKAQVELPRAPVAAATAASSIPGSRTSSLTRPGSLRPPDELGRYESSTERVQSTAESATTDGALEDKKIPGIHPRIAAARKRSMAAIRGTHAFAAAKRPTHSREENDLSTKIDGEPTMLCSLTYRGMEVIFASTHEPSWKMYSICARTHLVLQTLELPSPDDLFFASTSTSTRTTPISTRIVSVTANQSSGMVAIAMSDGTVKTYNPVATNPAIHPFGRFRWVNGSTIRCSRIFYDPAQLLQRQSKKQNHAPTQNQNNHNSTESLLPTVFVNQREAQPGQSLVLSSSRDQKLLVAHRNQLAVFDVKHSGATLKSSQSTAEATTANVEDEGVTPPVAQLLWIASVPKSIITASMSGDGHALAVVTEDGGTPGVYDTICGVRIFVRDEGWDDTPHGSSQAPVQASKRNQPQVDDRLVSTGLLYKEGPFLEHSEPVTRISFRGLGHNTALPIDAVGAETVGAALGDTFGSNDLLLTYSKHDNIARIFHQHDWAQLVQWMSPSKSRVDWVHGAAAFSLGDLETQKKLAPEKTTSSSNAESSAAHSSNPPSRSQSSNALAEEVSGACAGMLPGNRQLLHHNTPSSSAGAWIAETTFSCTHPAIRLSRLSFLKRGSETMQPALFESVTSMLPAGSMAADSILNAGDEGLSIHGIWPAWNPWLSDTTPAMHSDESLSGSAMSFLGLSSGPSSTAVGNFGENILGGPHCPPNELRIVGAHCLPSNVVIWEFFLWGNRDAGELELGSPTRFVLSLPDIERTPAVCDKSENDNSIRAAIISASTDYESNRLVATLRPDSTSIALTWRKQGTMSILPSSTEFHRCEMDLNESVISQIRSPGKGAAERFTDCSLIPAPLSLPSISLPLPSESIRAILWWHHENFGAPLRLVTITSTGTLLIFEVAPPWSAHEPPIQNTDLFFDFACSAERINGVESFQSMSIARAGVEKNSANDNKGSAPSKEYDVMITPDPDFGLGLRLESQIDGMPAIVGSYKKHPLTGGRLPAEKAGMIVIGDELLRVNGVRLEGMSFDDIVAAVRQVGASAGPGEALCMRFREANRQLTMPSNVAPRPLPTAGEGLDRSHRSGEHIFGGSFDAQSRREVFHSEASASLNKRSHLGRSASCESKSCVTNDDTAVVSVGVEQQEFCRLVGAAKNVFSLTQNQSSGASSFFLSPWTSTSSEVPVSADLVGATLLFFSNASKVCAYWVEVSPDTKAYELGLFDLDDGGDRKPVIQGISIVETQPNQRCLAVHDNLGTVRLIFAILDERLNPRNSGSLADTESEFSMSFRQHCIFRFDDTQHCSCILRASTLDLLATGRTTRNRLEVSVWTARPHAAGKKHGAQEMIQEYCSSLLAVDPVGLLVDLCFLQSGRLDAFPLLAIFLQTEVLLYRRSSEWHGWNAVRVVSYSSPQSSHRGLSRIESATCCSPLDSYPHLVNSLLSIADMIDEKEHLRADWHPDSLLARVCTDYRGPDLALLDHVGNHLLRLAKSLPGPASDTEVASCSSLASVLLQEQCDSGNRLKIRRNEAISSNDFSCDLKQSHLECEDKMILRKLQSALSQEFACHAFVDAVTERERERQTSMLPPQLQSFSPDDLRMLWALGEVVLVDTDFGPVDKSGKFFIFSSELFMNLKLLGQENSKESKSAQNKHPTTSFGMKRMTSRVNDTGSWQQLPSAATLFALTSNSQAELVDFYRSIAPQIDWTSMKEYHLPLWVRSDILLAKLAEEVGQNTFRAGRDIMECALFFIMARKLRTLRNLAATDSSDSGSKFYKFISGHDFSSDRGRRAAEKNAYSLLRKRRYRVAAAFFLLAEPPFLRSALEVISTQLGDLDLAFLVARLTESSAIVHTESLDAIGDAIHRFNGIGGGGGYALATQSTSILRRDEEPFSKWYPSLKAGAKSFILDRGLAHFTGDNCLTAVQLMWLGQKDEASYWLSGLAGTVNGISRLPDVGDALLPIVMDRVTGNTAENKIWNAGVELFSRVNSLQNFLYGPLLLRAIDAGARAKLASSLTVSSALAKCGIESAARALLLETDAKHLETLQSDATKQIDADTAAQSDSIQSASFDGAEIAAPVEVPSKQSDVGSTIFGDFDTAPPLPKKPPSHATELHSSIFDDFNPAPSRGVKDTQSSIFDDFNPAPQKPKEMLSTGQMESSIFDDFAAVPPTIQKQSETGISSMLSSGQMESSVFDDFTAVSRRPNAPQKQPETENSAIFDSFDAQSLPNAVTASQSEGKLMNTPKVVELELFAIAPSTTPQLWYEWRDQLLKFTSARRIVREIACLLASMHGDSVDPPAQSFSIENLSLLPGSCTEILQLPCEGEIIIRTRQLAKNTCREYGFAMEHVVPLALRMLDSTHQHHRLFYAVLLHLITDCGDRAEDLVRQAAHWVMHCCHTFTMSNDPISIPRKSMFQKASLSLLAQIARTSWQLEICLWLHRGGSLCLSGVAMNEAIVAVRVGFAMASWNRSFESLEELIKCEPDCQIDREAGRQLWTSLKIASNTGNNEQSVGKVSSGGWEFLVDCRRSEATDLLRHKQTGCFIIRPHKEDHGVFTLSFKTNLVPSGNLRAAEQADLAEQNQSQDVQPRKPSRHVKKDDIVQHAIIRLSDSGFRCGSFGPFGSLVKLLEAVSASLPFDLRFDKPPAERIIKDEGSQPSPNAIFLRKLALRQADSLGAPSMLEVVSGSSATIISKAVSNIEQTHEAVEDEEIESRREHNIGVFLELLILSSMRSPLGSIASAKYEDQSMVAELISYLPVERSTRNHTPAAPEDSPGQTVSSPLQEQYMAASRMLRPFLTWCRVMELSCETDWAPGAGAGPVLDTVLPPQITLSASETGIEAIEEDAGRGDSILHCMIQPNSGVNFRTLRLADGSDSTVVILFSKDEALEWLIKSGAVKSEGALGKLEAMENSRVIEPIDLSHLQLKAYATMEKGAMQEGTEARYRIVDPWEVEALDNREGETKSAAIGRESFLAFSLAKVAEECECIVRRIGGFPALQLWNSLKGGVALTKAIASVYPPWERSEGGDAHVIDGTATELEPLFISIRQHLYRNSLFRNLRLPQRFLTLVQVELLDLKNLTAPSGSFSLMVYALLRLRRSDPGAPLTNKTRTLDTAATQPVKLAKSLGPNAPASWGSVVRFRFPLPADVACSGASLDRNREILFKGPPCVLQLSVYERKLLLDNPLGNADIKIGGLAAGGQLEEWVPLQTGKHGINWFARIRLTLRFELMCLSRGPPKDLVATGLAGGISHSDSAPSVGLQKIHHLSSVGRAQEDVKKSTSSPDLLGYFESMVY